MSRNNGIAADWEPLPMIWKNGGKHRDVEDA